VTIAFPQESEEEKRTATKWRSIHLDFKFEGILGEIVFTGTTVIE
jgi:hypothetical protein